MKNQNQLRNEELIKNITALNTTIKIFTFSIWELDKSYQLNNYHVAGIHWCKIANDSQNVGYHKEAHERLLKMKKECMENIDTLSKIRNNLMEEAKKGDDTIAR